MSPLTISYYRGVASICGTGPFTISFTMNITQIFESLAQAETVMYTWNICLLAILVID